VIVATHYRFRKRNGCPPAGNCQLKGFPVISWIAIISMAVIILSMPLIPGQQYGLYAGLILTALYTLLYFIKRHFAKGKNAPSR
jgi:AAT family amino acid transporter